MKPTCTFTAYSLFVAIICGFALSSCTNPPQSQETIKAEIKKAENNFRDEMRILGAAGAFFKYAAPDAVIKRENDTLIRGAESIKAYYSQPFYHNATADWEPEFIEVSPDGNLAYTYGRYEWTVKRDSLPTLQFNGVFHTVWRRMPNGEWKYVWD
ncbi:MAG: nuclear transport factor 2 family protein [Chloroherpetonaceae bacterium]|nr:nuclear transport factor 2 family protein [Chloroherpetonaceae bacterium]